MYCSPRNLYRWICVLFLLGIFSHEAFALYPEFVIAPRRAGRPDPRWQVFDWRSIERKSGETNYRLFFDESEREFAQFVEPLIQDQIRDLEERFGTGPKERFDYVLFTSLADFRQANVFDISEGVRGVTSTAEATMAVPFTGDPIEFQHVSKHEMVHQFQVQKVRNKAGDYDQAYLAAFPLWFIEGMAEYLSLGGLDQESEHYLRDLIQNPDQREKYLMPEFFAPGELNFIFVYKVGQAKIDYLETHFGSGISQRIMEQMIALDRSLLSEASFQNVVLQLTGVSAEKVERGWKQYLRERMAHPVAELNQSLEDFEEVKEAGKNLDHFAVSPNGRFLAIREIDQLTGRVFISLIDLNTKRKTRVVRSETSRVSGLYFQQAPNLTLSDNVIFYIAETIRGPVMEWRRFELRNNQIHLEPVHRVELKKMDLLDASSPALTNEGRLAFVGLGKSGWPSVYVAEVRENQFAGFRRVTNDRLDYSSLQWMPENASDGETAKKAQLVLADSNRSLDDKRTLVQINTETGEVKDLINSRASDLAPSPVSSESFLFQSWQSGSSQIHLMKATSEYQLTHVKTWMGRPVYARDRIFALGFRSGRFRLYQIPIDGLKTLVVRKNEKPIPDRSSEKPEADWSPNEEVMYRPFQKGNFRVDQLGGYISTGGISGIQGVFSDLMRDYQISTQIVSPDNPNFFSANLLLSSGRGRSIWTLGAYRVVQPKVDSTFADRDDFFRFFIRTESGALGQIRYPFNQFGYMDFGLSLARMERRDFSDPSLETEWRRQNPEAELLLSPSISFGYDNILYELFSGPLEGFSLLLQTETDYLPSRGLQSQQVRLDFASYFRIYGRSLLAIEGLTAASFGGVDRDAFLVSGDDILRAYTFGDIRLTGTYLAAAKAEIRFPLGMLFRLPNLRGLLHYDYGAVAESVEQLDERISSSYGVGVGLSLPPASINFVWAWPLERVELNGERVGDRSAVFHFTLRYLYF